MFESVQSALDPAGRGATRIGESACAVVLGGSLVTAIATLLAICGVSIAFSHDALQERLRVQITSRQSWWEIHYEPRRDDRILVNELRVPLRHPVELTVSAGKGAVSRFYVPALELEADVQPGQPARLLVIAMNRGVFPAEGGALAVIAEESGDFDEWLARQAAPSVAPTDPALQDGRAAFFRANCNGCHAIRGTAAHGRAGPDLTHVGARRSLAGDSLDEHLDTAMRREKTRAGLAHQQLELRAIATYLASLK